MNPLQAVTNIPDWHRYVLAVLISLQVVASVIATGTVAVPPALHDAAPWFGLLNVFLVTLLPRIQDTTGTQPSPPNPRG